MKHFALTFFMLGCLLLQGLPATAQTNDLSPEELEIFREEVRNRTNRFQKYLTFIADKGNDSKTKSVYIKQALRLFIGEGEDYKDADDNLQPAVGIETTSKTTGEKSWQKTKTYLNRLTQLNYKQIDITWVDTCRMSNFYKVRDGMYTATVTVSQRFAGYRDNGAYIDTTVKNITVYLFEDLTLVGGRFRLLFGDIEALETY